MTFTGFEMPILKLGFLISRFTNLWDSVILVSMIYYYTSCEYSSSYYFLLLCIFNLFKLLSDFTNATHVITVLYIRLDFFFYFELAQISRVRTISIVLMLHLLSSPHPTHLFSKL